MTPRVELVALDAGTLAALADGDAERANRDAPVLLSPWLVGEECRALWRRRAAQVAADPASARWVTGVVWDPDHRLAVGRAGFHGPPDGAGMVEVGYATDPGYRRRGYARAALRALLDRAAVEPGVRTVRASVGPHNLASRDLVLAHGFVEVGEQEDEVDGLEVVYERPVRAASAAPA